MEIILIDKNRFKELFDITCLELSENRCIESLNNAPTTRPGYINDLREMHRKFIYYVRTLQSKLRDSNV